MRQHDRQRHVLLRFVSRITEHDTLVTGAMVLERAVVETLGNIGRLLLDRDENVASLVVEALLGVVVTNLLDSVTDDLLIVNVGLGCNLAKDHDHAGL